MKMVTDIKREEIKKEARQILDKFSKALKGVELKGKSNKHNGNGFRDEGKGKECDMSFRDRMFENAPEKEGDFIIAEKKQW